MSTKACPLMMQKIDCIQTIRTTITQLNSNVIDEKPIQEINLFLKLKRQVELMEKLYEMPQSHNQTPYSKITHGNQSTFTLTGNSTDAE